MSEPTLESIEDYDTLKGEKKKIVWAVILTGLLMGVVYSYAYNANDTVDDKIETQQTIKTIPVR
jgi:hypothetical protein